jgi:hypothetical protein
VTEPATGIVMHPNYARTIAQMAYVWGWPIVNMINRRARITHQWRAACRAARPDRHAGGLHRAVGDVRHLSQLRCRLWPWVLRA